MSFLCKTLDFVISLLGPMEIGARRYSWPMDYNHQQIPIISHQKKAQDLSFVNNQGSKRAKAGGAEKRGRDSIDIKCPISGLHLHVNILNFWLICNGGAIHLLSEFCKF